LFRASGSADKRLLKIDGAGHNDLLAVGMREYMRAVAERVRLVGERKQQAVRDGAAHRSTVRQGGWS
jgi:hypothetical protein